MLIKRKKETNHGAQQLTGGALSGIVPGNTAHRYQSFEDRADVAAADCVVVTVDSHGGLSPSASEIDRRTHGYLGGLVKRGLVKCKRGSTLLVPLSNEHPAKTVILAVVGFDVSLRDREYRDLVQAVYAELTAIGASDAALFLTEVDVRGRDEYWKIRQQVVALEHAAYVYRRAPDGASESLQDIFLAGPEMDPDPIEDGRAMAVAINAARALGDTPPNICTPSYLADYAVEIADSYSTVSAEILDERDMAALGMGAALSVGNASDQGSRFVVLDHRGADVSQRPYVLVGKGITFDTGGTSLKTRQAMRLMKYDMCGAAVVMAVLQAVAILGLPINVIAVAACAENMPGGKATRPSDAVISMSGKIIEILNPDAEGRLVLCDALTYVKRFDPELVIDVATLTGASLTALGRHYSAMFTRDDALSRQLIDAGEMAIDKAWRLPLSEEDLEQLDSQYADIANIGDGTAGCVVAAIFLSQFAESFRWAHLDVSGTAKIHGETVGATGRPAGLLLQYLLNQARVNAG